MNDNRNPLDYYQLPQGSQLFLRHLKQLLGKETVFIRGMGSGPQVRSNFVIDSPIYELGVQTEDNKPQNTPLPLGANNYMNFSVVSRPGTQAVTSATFTPYALNGNSPPRTKADMSPLTAIDFTAKWNFDYAWVIQDLNISSRYFAFSVAMTFSANVVVDCYGYFH